MSTDFLAKFSVLATRLDWPLGSSPASLLSEWEGFVEQCEAGYTMNIYEYRNDVRCRSRIEAVLRAEELQSYPELREFEKQVHRVDERFRSVLLPGVALPTKTPFWWENGVPKHAGDQLRRDIKDWMGIEISLR